VHRFPLLIPGLTLAVGVWLADRAPVDAASAVVAAAVILALGARRLRGVTIPAAALLLGAAAVSTDQTAPGGSLGVFVGDHPVDIRGSTVGPPEVSEDGSWTARLDLAHPAEGSLRLRASRGAPPPPGAGGRGRARLDELHNTPTPGQRDRRRRALRDGTAITARPTGSLTVTPSAPGTLVRTRRAVRAFLLGRLEAPVDGLALALVLGDRSLLDEDLRERFARTGTSHLLAISGLHVGIVALVVGWLARSVGCRLPRLRRRIPPRLVGLACGLVAAAVYGSLTGWSTSTRRAGAMAAGVAAALVMRRKIHPLQVCSAAWCGLLLGDPAALWEAGTALSFGSVVALIRLTPRNVRAPLPSLAAASAAAALGTAPLSWAWFGRVSLGGVPCNLVAIPVLGAILVPLLLAACGLGLVWEPGGTALLAVADTVARAGCAVLEIGAAASPVVEASPPPGLAVAATLVMGAALALPKPRQRWLGALAAAALALAPVHPGAPPRGELVLTGLAVGHGDALLISLPDGSHVLVDAGDAYRTYDVGERLVVPALRRMGIRRLRAVAVSHLHSDHFGGAAAVLRALPTDELWLPVPISPDHTAAGLMDEAARLGLRVRVLSDGATLPSSLGGVRVRALHPRRDAPCPGVTRHCPPNGHSMVLRLVHGRVSYLLAGDAEADLERQLIRDGAALRSQVLKVPHHGSATSSTAPFVGAVRPLVAVASLDRGDRHDLPRPSVVSRYAHAGATFLDTGRHGTLQVATDGRGVRVRRFDLPGGWTRWRAVSYARTIDSPTRAE